LDLYYQLKSLFCNLNDVPRYMFPKYKSLLSFIKYRYIRLKCEIIIWPKKKIVVKFEILLISFFLIFILTIGDFHTHNLIWNIIYKKKLRNVSSNNFFQKSRNRSKIQNSKKNRDKIDTHIHDRSLPWLGTGTSINSGCVKLFYIPTKGMWY